MLTTVPSTTVPLQNRFVELGQGNTDTNAPPIESPTLPSVNPCPETNPHETESDPDYDAGRCPIKKP